MFPYRPFVAPEGKGVTVNDNIEYPFDFDEVFGENYFLMPNFFTKGNFGQSVRYVDDVKNMFGKDIKIELKEPGKAEMTITQMGEFATVKRKEWAFQEEYRFVLCAIPSIPHEGRSFEESGFSREFSSSHIQAVLDGKYPPMNYIDVNLGESLQDVVVTLGPLCDRSSEIVVRALLEKFVNTVEIKHSELAGTIRKPVR